MKTRNFMRLVVLLLMVMEMASYAAAGSEARKGTDRRPHAKATFDALKPLAEQGSAVAQQELGVMYRKGEGVRQDYAKAAKWFRRAADQGLAEAQNNLGGLYATGLGVEKDYVQAYKWFTLAASRKLAAGRDNRDKIAGEMTPDQIAKAKRLAQKWKPVEKNPLPENAHAQ
ncbi:MAG: Sel1 domain-containing [Geobacteraceae bacterium]|nr:MAG: Sel1 domain-containing [Geobacteraceae bacterium]